ncbi:MAG: helix-hairpin-helix domain-containing protein [Niveispirillum sp.]|uniref:helix-hairpin-helix domain-containing protein n=1 Tax=Niveispirillum sp. TaxID=1917217 RepID=UPI0040371BE3
MTVIKLTSQDGKPVEFVPTLIGQGGMKDVYFSPDRTYVVAFYRDKLDHASNERLQAIVGSFRDGIFNRAGGDYWQNLFRWPTGIVEWGGRTGITVPTYQSHFFFEHGSKNDDMLKIKGREKEGKWFSSASNRNSFLDPRELGTWLSYFRICILISRAVRRLHAAGLAHSDLSYKNVLVDPAGRNACIIDIDGLVVPGKYPPDVVGTPDFIAPEVMATSRLAKADPKRFLPSITTDRHALAVLIYMYLLYRHPLRGGKVHDQDPARDEELGMGERALFVEHPTDASNRIRLDQVKKSALPWADAARLPFTLTGPLLAPLFKRAFIDGLHTPSARPTADDWEFALVRTVDLMQPCQNHTCQAKWYVFDNTVKPTCPFCGTAYRGLLPVLNLYSSRKAGTYTPDNHRVMVYDGQSLFPWHVNRNVFPNEKLSGDQTRRVGYFRLHQGIWYLVNERLPDMKDLTTGKAVPPNSHVDLVEGKRLLLSTEEGGRVIQVQMVVG